MKTPAKYIRVKGHLYVRAEEKKKKVEFVRQWTFDNFTPEGAPTKGHQWLWKAQDADEYYVVSFSPMAQEVVVFRADKEGAADTSKSLGFMPSKDGDRDAIIKAMEYAGLELASVAEKVYGK